MQTFVQHNIAYQHLPHIFEQFWGGAAFKYDFQQILIAYLKLFGQNSSVTISVWFETWWTGGTWQNVLASS